MPGPQVGEAAPDFTLPRSLDAVLTLSECLAHGPALLHFYVFLDSIIIPLCWIRYLPLLIGSAQTEAIHAYHSSMSRYRYDRGRVCASRG